MPTWISDSRSNGGSILAPQRFVKQPSEVRGYTHDFAGLLSHEALGDDDDERGLLPMLRGEPIDELPSLDGG